MRCAAARSQPHRNAGNAPRCVAHREPGQESKRPRPEGVALACPAKRGVGRREGPVGAVLVSGAPRGGCA